VRLDEATIATLSTHVPEADLRRMRVITGRPWRWIPIVLRMSAITFAPFVFFGSGRFRTDTPRGLALIAHEAVHLAQARELGGLRFYARYLWGNLRCGFRHANHMMERPAIAVQRSVRQHLDQA